jgi:hypothetical protein
LITNQINEAAGIQIESYFIAILDVLTCIFEFKLGHDLKNFIKMNKEFLSCGQIFIDEILTI